MAINLLAEITADIPDVELEPGIKKMVGILNSKGLATLMSCEGHSPEKDKAWIEIQPACFKSYMKAGSKKMERFLRAGEGLWFLRLDYFGQSFFSGLGRARPRLKAMKRVVKMEMTVTILLRAVAVVKNSSRKTKEMRTMEIAAQKYL